MSKQGLVSGAYAAIYALINFLVALTLAWIFLAQQNFWYGLWHDAGGIAEAIERYGPKNRYRSGFADTSRAQRIELFADINTAVHSSGDGLKEIRYKVPNHAEQTLLREPEVVHLQDVADLIDFLKYAALLLFVIWCFLSIVVIKRKRILPLIQQIVGLGSAIGVFTVVLLVVGPGRVFNTLHIWVFPKDHQWFFFYQDSLMSTMMKAPVLFAWIAAALIFWAFIFYIAIQFALKKYLAFHVRHK